MSIVTAASGCSGLNVAAAAVDDVLVPLHTIRCRLMKRPLCSSKKISSLFCFVSGVGPWLNPCETQWCKHRVVVVYVMVLVSLCTVFRL
jgi:hypothetical protein